MTEESLKTKAVLATVQLPDVSDEEHAGSLAELSRLVHTLGFEVVGQVSQKRKSPTANAVLGAGKLKELAKYTGGIGVVEAYKKNTGSVNDEEAEDEIDEEVDEEDSEEESDQKFPKAGIVIFDCETSATQLRNLEKALDVEVLDRTGVILEIFSRHARSREAKLQVEIAKLGYLAPRLRESNTGGDRQGGGIGAKGAGETAHELDRRRIRDRIAELRGQLNDIRDEQENRRNRRTEAQCVALVGYTNAGKSSLMRALTGSEVLVADKLFATLDTTVRSMQPESNPRVLISDTVGFIKKLPHDLVASFRSTLDEANNASLLLFVVDCSDPNFRSQLEVTRAALGEIVDGEVMQKIVLNKIDQLQKGQIEMLRREFKDAVFISTRNPDDIKFMKNMINQFFEKTMAEEVVFLPYMLNNLIGEIRKLAKVVNESHDERGTTMTLRASPANLERLKKLMPPR